MPHPSVYHGATRSFIPTTFTDEYNRHGCVHAAAEAMGIPATRLSVIASRLRRRGFNVRQHPWGKKT